MSDIKWKVDGFADTANVSTTAREWTLEALKIISFATLAAIIYGILHDQVTAHVSVEYFTIAHPPVFPTQSPFLLAIGWGIIATWWVGLPLGILLAVAARLGRNAKCGLGDLRRKIVLLMIVSGCTAMIAGVTGASLFAMHVMELTGEWATVIPKSRWPYFAFALWAHSASYLVGVLGGMFLVGTVLKRRLDA